jgi:hypothetical protein
MDKVTQLNQGRQRNLKAGSFTIIHPKRQLISHQMNCFLSKKSLKFCAKIIYSGARYINGDVLQIVASQ